MAENEKKRGGVQFSEQHQPPNKAKQKPKGKTLIKQAIGLDSWESLQNYLIGKGAEKFIIELQAMEGKDFTINFLASMEFFKPKLARTEISGEIDTTITEIRRTVIGKKV